MITKCRSIYGWVVYRHLPSINKGEYRIMKRMTTTKQISDVLSNNLLQVAKAEVYHKTSRETEIIDTDKFYEDFSFLCESGCFVNCVGWHYKRDFRTGDYIIETGRMDGNSENVVTVYLRVVDGVDGEEVEKAFLFLEG